MLTTFLALSAVAAATAGAYHVKNKIESDNAAAAAQAESSARTARYADLNEQLMSHLNDLSSEDIYKMSLDNADWSQDNSAILNSIMNDKLRRENYDKDLKAQLNAYANNGLNPMLALGFNPMTGASSNSMNLQSSNDELLEAKLQQNAETEQYRDKMMSLRFIGLLIALGKFF